jgi:hypothetical protein
VYGKPVSYRPAPYLGRPQQDADIVVKRNLDPSRGDIIAQVVQRAICEVFGHGALRRQSK